MSRFGCLLHLHEDKTEWITFPQRLIRVACRFIGQISHFFCFQIDVAQRLREQLKHLEHQREEEQLERARVINSLTQRLEESQQQCAKLLQTSG